MNVFKVTLSQLKLLQIHWSECNVEHIATTGRDAMPVGCINTRVFDSRDRRVIS